MSHMSETKVIYDAGRDPSMQNAYFDVDEMRERVLEDGRVLPYRYVHGGIREHAIKFIFCYPPREAYRGRFFQYLSPFPGPDEELASLDKTGEDDKIAFCLLHGAYYVESNMGSAFAFGAKQDAAMCFRASAAAAEWSRKVAMEYYGCGRPFGYVHGGSGGGYKTMACIENTNAWDGAVPYVIGSPYSLPNTVTMHVKGQRVLRHVFGKIADALDAGGSGNPWEGLDKDEAATLTELTQMGISPKAWYFESCGAVLDGSTPVLLPGVKAKDPAYFEEFWKEPGYEGADPASTACRDRLVFRTRVRSVHAPCTGMNDTGASNGVDDSYRKMAVNGKDAWIELEEIPRGEDLYLKGVNVCLTSGAAAGKQMLMDQLIPSAEGKGGIVTIGMCYGLANLDEVVDSIRPGDEIVLDNSDYIAIQSYYRHQVPPDPSFHAWDHLRKADGSPLYPQRAHILGPEYCGTGTVQDGQIQGKVINIQGMWDESTCNWCADWYRHKIMEAQGDDRNHRVWYMDRCMHGDLQMLENNKITNYLGAMRQALLDLSDWVERGIEPPMSTAYRYEDGQILVPETAAERRGVQPTARLTANGRECLHVKAGEKVTLRCEADVPAGAGSITFVDFDFEEHREFPAVHLFATPGRAVSAEGSHGVYEAEHVYDRPGTWFASVRVKAERRGDATDPFTQVKNIARARIIVEA